MTNPLIEQKVKELAESLPIAVRWSHGALEDPYHSLIRQALLSLYNQGQVDALEDTVRVSWDIADGGKEWVVQFWRKDQDGTMTLLTQLDKNSDDGGSFDIASLKQQPL